MDRKIELLETIDFLRPLGAAALRDVAATLPRRSLQKGSNLFWEGDHCEGFWIVERGSVSVYKLAADGRMQILQTVPQGKCFALVPAIDGGGYPACAETREPSTLVLFPRDQLLQTIRKHPDVGIAVAANLSRLLRRVTRKVASLTLRDVRERVAGYLLDCAAECGVVQPDGSIELELAAGQEEIAKELGTVREVVARSLRALRDRGVIEQKRSRVRLVDPERLRLVASA